MIDENLILQELKSLEEYINNDNGELAEQLGEDYLEGYLDCIEKCVDSINFYAKQGKDNGYDS